MKDYYNYSGYSLVEYVLTSVNNKEILVDKDFQDYIIKDGPYIFLELLHQLPKELANLFLNKSFLDKIVKIDNNALEKFIAIISLQEQTIKDASNVTIEFILSRDELKTYFVNISLNTANRILDYILEKDNSKLKFLSGLSPKVQDNLFNSDNINKILNLKEFDDCYLSFCPEVIVKLFNYEKYRNRILNLSVVNLDKLIKEFKDYELPKHIQNNERLINKIVNIESPSYYRSIVKSLLPSNYNMVDILEDKRKIKMEELFQSLIEMIHLEDTYMDSSINKNNIVKEKGIKFFEYACDLYFKDYLKNVFLNMSEILNFIKETNEELIPAERKQLYEMVIKFNELSVYEIIDLYNKMKRMDALDKLLYDDIKTVKNRSYEMFNESFIKLEERKELEDKELTKEYGVKVYKLDGEDFTALVHVGKVDKNSLEKTISLSVIGNNGIGMYDDFSRGIIMGYEKLDANRVMHVYNGDSFSEGIYGTDRVNKIFTPDDLIRKTNYFNEILYSEQDGNVLFPDYVVCKDEIDGESIDYAKEHNLPIVIINTLKYDINIHRESAITYQEDASEELEVSYFGKK